MKFSFTTPPSGRRGTGSGAHASGSCSLLSITLWAVVYGHTSLALVNVVSISVYRSERAWWNDITFSIFVRRQWNGNRCQVFRSLKTPGYNPLLVWGWWTLVAVQTQLSQCTRRTVSLGCRIRNRGLLRLHTLPSYEGILHMAGLLAVYDLILAIPRMS